MQTTEDIESRSRPLHGLNVDLHYLRSVVSALRTRLKFIVQRQALAAGWSARVYFVLGKP